MQAGTFDRSKYNITWISILVILLGTIIYPTFFERARQKQLQPVVQTITPVVVAPVTEVKKPAPSTTASASSRMMFTRDLKVGDKGPDVKKLQQYLNQRGFIVAESGNGSPGQETELFGPGTKDALKRFQESYAEILLKPYGLTEGTGYLGSVTRNFINS